MCPSVLDVNSLAVPDTRILKQSMRVRLILREYNSTIIRRIICQQLFNQLNPSTTFFNYKTFFNPLQLQQW